HINASYKIIEQTLLQAQGEHNNG
ncbi:hypothetical protein AB0862_007220, partial [Acinetobacter baumannii]